MGFDGVQLDPARERPYWVAFHHVPFVGPASIRRMQQVFGSLESAWHVEGRRLRAALNERAAAAVESTRRELDVNRLMADLERDRISVATLAEPEYPRLLREIHAPPPVIFYRGDLAPEDETAVAIVGTRQVSGYGRAVAQELAADLARAGVTIVSGLAKGVDGIAHQATLEAGGRTIAVLGGGINRLYPYEHRHLAARITASGAVLSTYAPDSKPEGHNFPARNRIISGLALGIVVVEAPERSGALITVDFAADQGRDVFAVPGPIGSERSAGCHRILRDGARLVRDAGDILEDLRLRQRVDEVAVQQALPLGEDERRVLAVLTGDPMHIDDIGEQANLASPLVSAFLITLELQGLVRNAGAQHYIRIGRGGG